MFVGQMRTYPAQSEWALQHRETSPLEALWSEDDSERIPMSCRERLTSCLNAFVSKYDQ